ncbi:hypothetical protein LOY57_11025 [Pseudomonas moraviensis]|uniref:hypothetical protein n=1 Tax=Pseudomonas moraviensis TaxID=321662 RepID=UPI00215DF135|nr:hypothetical protein [Pseudomonas moraviensis]UVL48295.1 hypothetical protein LOY57_11025 [Pseudomonas moraviensis]
MKRSKVLALTSEHFQRLMEQASAGFELDCRQACRGLKVSMAVNVFGLGTLLPNSFADEDIGVELDAPSQISVALRTVPLVPKRAATTQSNSISAT